MLRDFVIALSLANLWFFNVWRVFLITHATSYPYYHWKANPAPIILAVVFDVLLLAIMLWLGITVARRAKRAIILKIVDGIVLLMFFVVVTNVLAFILVGLPLQRSTKALADQLQSYFPSLATGMFYTTLWILAALLFLVLSTILIHALVYKRERLTKFVVGVILVMSPFVFFTISQGVSQWLTFRSGTQFREQSAPATPQSPNSQRRILWVIFDEMDYRLSFADRAVGVSLPAFDRLRKESIFGTNAYPPAGDTSLSLPAMITGRLVSQSTRSAPNELILRFADKDQTVPWSTQPNVFSRAREMGYNSALAGWYHPYCRIIGSNLRQCFRSGGLGFLNDQELANSLTESDLTLGKSMLRLAANTLLPSVVRLFLRSDEPKSVRALTLDGYMSIHQRAMEMTADPTLDLIMIHYPIPHPPGIYNRFNHDFSLKRSNGYFDNLALTDRTLGELRQKLEENQLWENTTLLISSDHSLRADRVWRGHPLWTPRMSLEDPAVLNSAKDERVPFLLKIAGASQGLNYERVFNTVLSQDLLLEVLAGQIATEEDVVQWLDQHRSTGESPYIESEK